MSDSVWVTRVRRARLGTQCLVAPQSTVQMWRCEYGVAGGRLIKAAAPMRIIITRTWLYAESVKYGAQASPYVEPCRTAPVAYSGSVALSGSSYSRLSPMIERRLA